MAQDSHWRDLIDDRHPAWLPYRPLLQRLANDRFPEPEQLQSLLKDITTHSEKRVSLVAADELESRLSYEEEIYRSGRVSTRRRHWHDLCNALVWARFPRIKCAMNHLHNQVTAEFNNGQRGAVRDALTLFDECGLIIVCSDRQFLEALAAHRWNEVFGTAGEQWPPSVYTWVVGHANLEKLLNPYKSMTANTLLIHAKRGLDSTHGSEEALLQSTDAAISQAMLTGQIMRSTRDFCPVPIAGIPDWWRATPQNSDFYRDKQVFRVPRSGAPIRPVFSLDI